MGKTGKEQSEGTKRYDKESGLEIIEGTDFWIEFEDKYPNFTGIYIHEEATYWYRNGKLHREDGPAVYWSEHQQSWYKHGKYHREDGPACHDLAGFPEWWYNGVQYNQEEWETIVTRKKKLDKFFLDK